MTSHRIDYRVYYEDTDAGGIMYHGNYINFCERGRTEMLRSVGHSCAHMHEQDGVIFVIRHLEADYLQKAKLEELLTVETCVKEVKNTSFLLNQTIFRHDDVLFKMRVTAVCVDDSGKPVRIPDKLRNDIKTYCNDEGI